jgi:hypothetical protein
MRELPDIDNLLHTFNITVASIAIAEGKFYNIGGAGGAISLELIDSVPKRRRKTPLSCIRRDAAMNLVRASIFAR